MTVNSTKLGPGTLMLGETGTGMDASCQLTGAKVAWDKDKADDTRVLCGDVIAGGTTYTAKISGTFLQDLAEHNGLVAYTWQHRSESVKFTFVPNTTAGATVEGTLVVDPIDVGGTDDYGATLTSDFEWDCVGEPTLSWATKGASEAYSLDVNADGADPESVNASVSESVGA